MGRLIKYELKKQQTSRNIILALLLVFLLAVVVGTFTENGNTVGISVMLEMFVGMFVFFYMGIESLLILNRDLKTKQSHMPVCLLYTSVADRCGQCFSKIYQTDTG